MKTIGWRAPLTGGPPTRTIAFDFETCLIRPGVAAPEAVCLTWAERVNGIVEKGIVRWDEAEPVVRAWLADDTVLLTGAHTAFDACVIGSNWPWLIDLLFRKYRLNLVTCVQYRDRLLDIAAGRFQGYHTKKGRWMRPTYDLAALSRRYRGIDLDKPIFDKKTGQQINDSWRLRYIELLYIPIEEWPPAAVLYAIEDAVATLEVHEHQEPHAEEYLGEQFNQARKAFALQLMSVWGLRTSAAGVIELANKATIEREKIRARLEQEGLVRADGTRDMKKSRAYMVSVCRELRIKVPLTDTGAAKLDLLEKEYKKHGGVPSEFLTQLEEQYPSLGEDACVMTGDETLKDYAAFGRWGSVLSKDVTALAKGTMFPIHTRPGMAATTRTTTSNPNIQNWGTGWGPRECFVARDGSVYIQADYPQLELRTLAQACLDLLGYSKMAEDINNGIDLHLKFAAVRLGITYEEALRRKDEKVVKNARNLGKVNNFGRPGGLGDKNLVKYAKNNFGIDITIEEAREMKEQWFAAFPEMREYFKLMGSLCDNPSRLGEIMIPRSKQIRGGAMYCALCNTPFQGLGAVCSGRALWLLAEACYVDRDSVLFGCRNVCHVHDENILESPDDGLVHERAMELARIMDVGANEYLVDVPMKTDPQAMRFWSKEAFDLRNGEGRIIAWNGEWKCETCKCVFAAPFKKAKKCEDHIGATRFAA